MEKRNCAHLFFLQANKEFVMTDNELVGEYFLFFNLN